MSRLAATVLVLGLLAGSVAPLVTLADAAGSARASAKCCHGMGTGCHETTSSLDCCSEPDEAPATPAQPQQSSPSSGASKKLGAPIALLPPAVSPDIARVASTSFVGRQGLVLHPPPHLRLRVFQI